MTDGVMHMPRSCPRSSHAFERSRTFRERLPSLLAETRVVGESGEPLGFSITKDDELYQLYVSAAARGKGVAQTLIAEVEARLAVRRIRHGLARVCDR